jgi:hypothetical protein
MLYMEKFIEIIGVHWFIRLNVGQIFYTNNIIGKKNKSEIINKLFS